MAGALPHGALPVLDPLSCACLVGHLCLERVNEVEEGDLVGES